MKKLICAVLIIASVLSGISAGFAAESSLYTENLFGDGFYACDTAEIGTSFTADVDSDISCDASGSSVRLTGRGRDLFKSRIAADLRGKKARLSFFARKDSTVTFDTDEVLLRYRIYFSDGAAEEKTDFYDTVIGTFSAAGDWQWFSADIELASPDFSGEYAGIEFFATVNGGKRVQLDGAMWIDCIALNVMPKEGELPTSVVSAEIIPNGEQWLADGVLIKLDTGYVSQQSVRAMSVMLNGGVFTAYSAAIETVGETAQIRILFDNPEFLSSFSVTGLKDIWGYGIAGDAAIDADTPKTKLTEMSLILEKEGLFGGVLMTLDTAYVTLESLLGMTVRLNSQDFTGYTLEIEKADNAAAVKILFDSAQSVQKFSVAALKDVWGYEVEVCAAISLETAQTYTENLLGGKYSDCEDVSGVASTFDVTADSTVAYEGSGSFKFTSSKSGSDLIVLEFPADEAEMPEKISFSFHYRLAEGTYVTGNAPYDYEIPIDRFRIYCKLLCRDEKGNITAVGPDGTAVVSGDPTAADWQFFRHTITPDYSYVTDGLTPVGIRIAVRPYLGILCRINGAVWLDKITATRIPREGEYVPAFIGAEPAKNAVNAPTDKVTFKFSGAIEESVLSEENVLINGSSERVKISKAYDAERDISEIILEPEGGFANSKNYTVSLSDVYDIWGRAVEGVYDTAFTTIGKFSVTNYFAAVDADGVEIKRITAAESGNIKAGFGVRNNTAQERSAVLVLASCTGEHIERVALSPRVQLQPGQTAELAAMLDGFDAGGGRYLRAFLWDTVSTHRPLAEIAELR